MDRCQNEKVFEKAVHMINGFKEYFISHNEVVYDNPAPATSRAASPRWRINPAAVCRRAAAPHHGRYRLWRCCDHQGPEHAVRPRQRSCFRHRPSTAPAPTMILFSTGRGTPFGAPAPTLKIATNSQLAAKKSTWIDFNAGVVADGEKTLDEAGADLYQLVLDVASGKQTCAEKKGFREISIFKDGVVL